MSDYRATLNEIERLETLLAARKDKAGYKANCEAIKQRLAELRNTLPAEPSQ